MNLQAACSLFNVWICINRDKWLLFYRSYTLCLAVPMGETKDLFFQAFQMFQGRSVLQALCAQGGASKGSSLLFFDRACLH